MVAALSATETLAVDPKGHRLAAPLALGNWTFAIHQILLVGTRSAHGTIILPDRNKVKHKLSSGLCLSRSPPETGLLDLDDCAKTRSRDKLVWCDEAQKERRPPLRMSLPLKMDPRYAAFRLFRSSIRSAALSWSRRLEAAVNAFSSSKSFHFFKFSISFSTSRSFVSESFCFSFANLSSSVSGSEDWVLDFPFFFFAV